MLTLRSNPYFVKEGELKVFVDEAGKQIFVDGYNGIDGILLRGKTGARFGLSGDEIIINYGSGNNIVLGKVSDILQAEEWVKGANSKLS